MMKGGPLTGLGSSPQAIQNPSSSWLPSSHWGLSIRFPTSINKNLVPSSSNNRIVNSRVKSETKPGPCSVSVSRPLMSSGVNMNVDSAQCWRTLSDQGTTGNGTDTCLTLVIVREWIQPRFRRGVVTAGHSLFLLTLLCSELVVDTVEVTTRSKGSISPNSPLNPIDSLERNPRLDVLKPAEGRVRQNVTCPIRDGIIYALIWVERSHVTRVSPLWQNRDVIFL